MAMDLNDLHNKFVCIDCGAVYQNQKDLEIHSFIHMECGEEILPIFNLDEINGHLSYQDIHVNIGRHSTVFQVNSGTILDAVEETSILKKSIEDIPDKRIKTCDSVNISPSPQVCEANP